MFWFAAKTAWVIARTAGGLILSRTAGDRLRSFKNLVVTKPTESGLKPATSFISQYFASRSIPDGPQRLRTTLFNIARLVYGTLLSFFTYLCIELYHISHFLGGEISRHLITLFSLGRDFLTKLTGPLTDALLVTYTVFYILGLLLLAYLALRLVHHVLYNLFSLRSLLRAVVDTVTARAEEEHLATFDKFHDEIKRVFDKTSLAGKIVLDRNADGSLTVREAPLPETTPLENSYDPVAKREADRFIAENTDWLEKYKATIQPAPTKKKK